MKLEMISYLMHCNSDAETAIEKLFTGTIEFYHAKQNNFTNRIGIIRNDQKFEMIKNMRAIQKNHNTDEPHEIRDDKLFNALSFRCRNAD